VTDRPDHDRDTSGRGAEPTQAGAGLWADAASLLRSAWAIEPRLMVLQLVLLAATGVTGGVSMLMLVPVVNSVASTSGGSGMSLPVLDSLDLTAVPLAVLLAAVVALVTAQALLVRWSSVNAVLLQQRLVDRLRRDALDAILAANWAFVLQARRSDVTEIATSGAARAGSAFTAILQGSVAAVIAFATAVVSGIVAPTLTVVVVIAMALMLAALLRNLRPAHDIGRQFGRRNRNLQAAMLDSLDSLRLVRAHGAAQVWRTQLADALVETRAVQLDHTRRTATTAAVATIGVIACAATLVLVAVRLTVPAATIVVVLVLAARLAQAVRTLAGSLQQAANGLPAVQDLADLTLRARRAEEAPASTRGLPPADPSTPVVRLRSVTFRYPGSDEGVTDLTFDLPRGRITALTGPSGAGKSTTADLVLGLLSPADGVVEVDGTVLTPDLLAAWRRRVAYVPQETVLLPGTIRWNLTWSSGRADVSDDECWAALDGAAAGFARDLPLGLDTPLGDRGTRLSGGQRQRLAIARALVRSPEVLVLDEATSALDEQTEEAVLALLAGLVPRLTILVIAHRSSTVDAAHEVIRLDRGRRVDSRPGP